MQLIKGLVVASTLTPGLALRCPTASYLRAERFSSNYQDLSCSALVHVQTPSLCYSNIPCKISSPFSPTCFVPVCNLFPGNPSQTKGNIPQWQLLSVLLCLRSCIQQLLVSPRLLPFPPPTGPNSFHLYYLLLCLSLLAIWAPSCVRSAAQWSCSSLHFHFALFHSRMMLLRTVRCFGLRKLPMRFELLAFPSSLQEGASLNITLGGDRYNELNNKSLPGIVSNFKCY